MKRVAIMALALLPFAITANQSDERCLAGDFCPRESVEPYPETGIWFNSAEPGSGFMFEFQNSHVAGYYFGYDAEGNPLWYLISGQLELAEDRPETWRLTAPLMRFKGGNCIDCDYVQPQPAVEDGTITLRFFTRAAGKFSVNAGASQPIQAYLFGSAGNDVFPGIDYPVPVLNGQWLLVIYDRQVETDEAVREYAASGFDVWIETIDVSSGKILHNIDQYFDFPEVQGIGEINCKTQMSGIGGRCTVELVNPPSKPRRFFMPITDIAPSYFSATAPDGDTIEGFRVNYD